MTVGGSVVDFSRAFSLKIAVSSVQKIGRRAGTRSRRRFENTTKGAFENPSAAKRFI